MDGFKKNFGISLGAPMLLVFERDCLWDLVQTESELE